MTSGLRPNICLARETEQKTLGAKVQKQEVLLTGGSQTSQASPSGDAHLDGKVPSKGQGGLMASGSRMGPRTAQQVTLGDRPRVCGAMAAGEDAEHTVHPLLRAAGLRPPAGGAQAGRWRGRGAGGPASGEPRPVTSPCSPERWALAVAWPQGGAGWQGRAWPSEGRSHSVRHGLPPADTRSLPARPATADEAPRSRPSCPHPPPPHTHTLLPRAQPASTPPPPVAFGFSLVLILKHVSPPEMVSQRIPIMSLIKLSEASRRPEWRSLAKMCRTVVS